MPRDANGNYTLPAGNPVVTQTNISSAWANDTMSDMGTEMTDSLSRSGKGGMTGPFPIVDSQGGVPGLSFTAEPTTGIKREGAGDMRAQVLGVDKMRWTSGGDAEVYRNAAWNPVAIEPTDRRVMYGEGGVTTIFHYGTTAAPGWTIEEPDANLRELIIGPAAGGGVIGGSVDPTALTQTATVTITSFSGTAASNGAHTHGAGGLSTSTKAADYNSLAGAVPLVTTQAHNHSVTGSTASAGAHTHTVSGTTGAGTADVNIAPRYARGVLMKLDA